MNQNIHLLTLPKMELSCSVRSCTNYGKCNTNLDLYPLPANHDELILWKQAFGLSSLELSNVSTRICGAHFRRKYFLGNKPEVNQNVNGSAPLVMLNTSSVATNQVFGNLINSSAFSNFVALKNVNEPSTYHLHIPDPRNIPNVHYPSSSSSTSPSIIQSYSICSTSPSIIQSYSVSSTLPSIVKSYPVCTTLPSVQTYSVCSTSPTIVQSYSICDTSPSIVQSNSICSTSAQSVFTIPNKIIQTVQPSSISEPSSNTNSCSEVLSTIESCELFCTEEKLTPEQEKFQREEWLNYVKFTAKVHGFPYVSAVNGSEVGEKVIDNVSSQELPVLVYTNIPRQSQSDVPSIPTSTLVPTSTFGSSVSNTVLIQPPTQPTISTSNTPFICQIASNVSVPLNVINPVINTVKPAATSVDTPSVNNTPVIIHHPVSSVAVPPDKINGHTDGQLTEKSSITQSKDEEIFPMVLKDTATEKMLNTVNTSVLSPICEINVSDENMNESTLSPAFSISSGNERYMSPDLLCNVEVNIEENGSLPLMNENSPAMLGSELESDNSNGPKIVDVLCGDAGANEFYKGIAATVSEQDACQDRIDAVPSENSMPKMVTQWSIFSMQKTIAVISSGTIEATVRNLLGLRIHIPPLNAERDIPTRLKNRLREDNFLTLTPWWMVQRRYLPFNPPCVKCCGQAFRLNSSLEFLDNLSWTCTKCKNVTPVKRPKFFDRFPAFSLEELLLLTYHWACKSRVWVINYDVPVHIERIWEYFNALQDLCGESVSRNKFAGKSTKYTVTVEVSAVKLGRYFILCAYDRRNKVSRLKALTTEEACSSLKHIKVLEEWLGCHCSLITWKKISDEFLPDVEKMCADPSIGHVQSPGRHILNASKFLGKTMVQLFQNMNHEQLSIETVQRILNEVQWRERHGKNEESAFWEILNEITRLEETYAYTEAQLGDIAKDRYYYKADTPFKLRWGPYDAAAKGPIITSVPALGSKQNTPETLPKNVSTPDILKILKKRHPISVAAVPSCKEKTAVDIPMSGLDLLSVKIVFTSDEKILKDYQIQANKLGIQLREQGYLENPIKWFCKKKFIKDKSTCYVCQGPAVLNSNSKFSEGVSWLCLKQGCKFENNFSRPPFFASIGFPLNVINAIIFHWAVQSDYNVLTQAIPMNEFNIIGVFRQIQKLCSIFTESAPFKIGGKKHLVEVAFVRFANCFILGAMERDTKCSRFRTFSSDIKLHIDIIRKTLISWLLPESTVIVNSNKYLGRYSMEEKIHIVFSDQSVTDINSSLYHTLTITNYLQGHIKTMFQSIKVQKMSSDLLQMYLDELMWRERCGKTPVDAFNGIMSAIFFDSKTEDSKPVDNDSIIVDAALKYGFSLPLPEVIVCLERLPDHVIHSYTSRVSKNDNFTIKENFESAKKIKQEPVSDEEIDVEFIPNSEDTSSSYSSKISVASSSSSTRVSNKIKIRTLELTNDIKPNLNKPIFTYKRSNSVSSHKSRSPKRYADRCYSHRRRFKDLKDGKLRCIECKDEISDDHFVKQYSCGDCKRYVYTTHCQKAFASHRSYILFGRKISDDPVYNRNIILPQKGYCSCGYGTREGNKLAYHLIKCGKTTCCLKSSNSVLIL